MTAEERLKNFNIARASQGLPPLEKLAGEQEEVTEENKTEENKEEKTPEEKKPEIVAELTDEQLIELLGKRGIKASSLEDLKPKENKEEKTPEQIAEEREAAKLTYALTKGLYKKAEYENFIAEQSAKEKLVFSQFALEAKAEDPTLTDEEISAEFAEKFGLDSEVGSRKHKRGAKEMNVIANEILKNKYSKIYEADGSFSAHEQSVLAEAARVKEINEKSPAYKQNIEDVFTKLSKISGKFDDQESFEVAVMQDSLAAIKNDFLKPEAIERQIAAGVTKEQIEKQAYAALVSANLPHLLKEHANQVLLAHRAGTKGIPAPAGQKKVTEVQRKLTPDQQKVFDEYRQAYPESIENN
jgi:hypothetical protein